MTNAVIKLATNAMPNAGAVIHTIGTAPPCPTNGIGIEQIASSPKGTQGIQTAFFRLAPHLRDIPVITAIIAANPKTMSGNGMSKPGSPIPSASMQSPEL